MAIVKSSFSRVWIAENGSAPNEATVYYGKYKIGDPSQSFGDVESIQEPDPNNFDSFIDVDSIRGETERPTSSLTARFTTDPSLLLDIARRGCQPDIQVHIGSCVNPQLYDSSWDKILVFENAVFTNYSIEGLGAIDSSERAVSNEAVDFSASSMYEISRLNVAEATSGANDTVLFIDVFGTRDCANCESSNLIGCETVAAVTIVNIGAGVPILLFSTDGMATVSTSNITGLAVAPTGLAVVGEDVVVLDGTNDQVYYANLEELVLGTATWQTVTGFTDGPVGIESLSPQDTWIIGDTGYVYKFVNLSIDSTTEVASATAMVDINMYDSNNILVATAATVYYTTNTGDTWTAATGTPGGGDPITAISMFNPSTWLIATSDGSTAALDWTKNFGSNYTAGTLPTGMQTISDIVFATPSVGFLVGYTASAGVFLRTTNGGRTWKVLPDKVASLPTNTQLNDVAICEGDPNTVYVAGQATAASVLLVGEA